MDPNLWSIRVTMRVPSYYKEHHPTTDCFKCTGQKYNIHVGTCNSNNTDDYSESSQSESHNNNDVEEEELQTPVIPITKNTLTQWESSLWYRSARYDYTQSGAFLNMGLGSPIDNLVEPGTLLLLDWNDSMTKIQLGMRFIDKVQAISVVQKWLISVGREYRVVKSKIIHGPQYLQSQ
ncbi:hypothetical protein M9H77_03169 [Catharanthus roseus]|uniref:Uncharacterized protein n=1 Tax=Catharanthus roseus TaxID=4058 RepID=A0ACC0CAY6_CATRO|nr:hypothetical protein M9H77_03169 [Catharanthus roseus]